jgi:hypothetical protein
MSVTFGMLRRKGTRSTIGRSTTSMAASLGTQEVGHGPSAHSVDGEDSRIKQQHTGRLGICDILPVLEHILDII